jgi:hypothetical protein
MHHHQQQNSGDIKHQKFSSPIAQISASNASIFITNSMTQQQQYQYFPEAKLPPEWIESFVVVAAASLGRAPQPAQEVVGATSQVPNCAPLPSRMNAQPTLEWIGIRRTLLCK